MLYQGCPVPGMAAAGGIGSVVSNGLQGNDYGTAGVATLLGFAVAYTIGRIFVRIPTQFTAQRSFAGPKRKQHLSVLLFLVSFAQLSPR